MALQTIRLVRNGSLFRRIFVSISSTKYNESSMPKRKEYKTENKMIYLEDPDKFGTLSGGNMITNNLEDEGDVKEQQFLENLPLKSQKLTIKQYADIIKQYLKHKRLKEAIDVLEVRMLKEDRVKPENYIYNILIGACADVGYTKKAFKLYNDMKRRALKPTGDTYTCLFQCCVNSPWSADGLHYAKRLRMLMIEKGIEPNLTNYNTMIKAFGRCGDISTAFQIVDEMVSKKIKIRVHTFNHLLQACISDKNSGLRHALIVWRKMLMKREKPNIYSFNLILKCVKECNLGTKEEVEELISIIAGQTSIIAGQTEGCRFTSIKLLEVDSNAKLEVPTKFLPKINCDYSSNLNITKSDIVDETNPYINSEMKSLAITDTISATELVNTRNLPILKEIRNVPNLLSKELQMNNVLALQEVRTLQDKFAVVGGQEDFLNEMASYSVSPDIKVFTQMIPLLDDNKEAEIKLMESMKLSGIKADIDFYNMLIKKRCMRCDYTDALEIKNMIQEESKLRKKKFHLKKKLRLKVNIVTYGVLALACKTMENAQELLQDMKDNQLKVNIEIMGALLRQGTAQTNFEYICYIMNIVKQENLKVNHAFMKHLENFTDKCSKNIDENALHTKPFGMAYKKFVNHFNKWMEEVNVKECLQPEHPWTQFRQNYPETIQRQNIVIEEPKKFYKRKRKFIPYIVKS